MFHNVYMVADTQPLIHPLPLFQMSPATQQMQPTQTLQSPPPSGGRRRRVVDEDPDERRRKFLERNRAAATRCRQKRKVWVMSLEKKAEELTQTNMQLQVHSTIKPQLKTALTNKKYKNSYEVDIMGINYYQYYEASALNEESLDDGPEVLLCLSCISE